MHLQRSSRVTSVSSHPHSFHQILCEQAMCHVTKAVRPRAAVPADLTSASASSSRWLGPKKKRKKKENTSSLTGNEARIWHRVNTQTQPESMKTHTNTTARRPSGYRTDHSNRRRWQRSLLSQAGKQTRRRVSSPVLFTHRL